MKKILKNGFFALVMLTVLAACKKEDVLNANLDLIDKNIVPKTELDNWLDENFLNPYNIETKYRFDRSELPLDKNLTPPDEANVMPVMEMVRDIWIKPYETVGGADFIKKIAPRQFVLVGSAEYNPNNSITLGTADGGRKITLFVLNSFSKTNLGDVQQMIHTIEHEYVHILNQNLPYQSEYQTISRGGYEANWTQLPLSEAYELGFITQYARSSPLEDFAEMASNMLMMGRVQATSIINAAPADGMVKLQKKEQLVVDYYKSAFNIDFYSLQTEVQKQFYKLSPPVLAKMIRPGIGYTSIYSKPSTDPNQSPEFLTAWNKAKDALANNIGYELLDIKLMFKTGNAMTLRYSFTNGTTTYLADADYTMTVNANGLATLTLLATQPTAPAYYPNMGVINSSVVAVNNYFKNNRFNIDWFNNSEEVLPTIGTLGGFFKSTDASSYFYGAMGF